MKKLVVLIECVSVMIENTFLNFFAYYLHLGDNSECIKNFHLGRYIVDYTVENLVFGF